jgi:hypothetical protein
VKKMHQMYFLHTRTRKHYTHVSLENILFPGTKNMRRTFDFLFYILLWLQQSRVLSLELTSKGEQEVLEGNNMKKCTKRMDFRNKKYEDFFLFFFICHYG